VTVWQTLLVFVVIPGAIYGLIALAAMGTKSKRHPRYRPGQEWKYPAVWWAGNPEGVGGHGAHHGADAPDADNAEPAGAGRTALGGASGNW
jgi:hypothetical protein